MWDMWALLNVSLFDHSWPSQLRALLFTLTSFVSSAGEGSWSSLFIMSQATKRKHVVKEVLGDFVTPTGNQQIVKVSYVWADFKQPPTSHCPDSISILYLCNCRSLVAVVTTSMKLSRPRVRLSWWACPPSSARTSGSREVTDDGMFRLIIITEIIRCHSTS